MDDDAPVEQSPGKAPNDGRDDKGRFVEGNRIGEDHRWTAEDHPKSAGRPKRRHFTDALMAHLEKPAADVPFMRKIAEKLRMDPDEATGFEVLMAWAIVHSAKGKSDVLRQLWERVEGTVPKHLTLAADDPVKLYIEDMRSATEPPPATGGGLPETRDARDSETGDTAETRETRDSDTPENIEIRDFD